MSFATYQALIDALQGGYAQVTNFYKAVPSPSAGYFLTLWTQAGSYVAGSNPTPALQGFALDKTTAGTFPFNNPVSPNRLFLFSLQLGSQSGHTLFLYDRLWHVGGINLNITTPQTFTGVTAPTRHTDGIANSLIAEITTAAGATGQTLSVSYTNENNVSGRTASIAIPASAGANRIFWGSLDTGDLGVKSVQECVLAGGMGGGVCNLVMVNMKQFFPIGWLGNQHIEKEYVLHAAALPEIAADSCLAFFFYAGGGYAVLLPKMILVEG